MQSGNAERVRHLEVDFEELAEVIGTRFELALEALTQWQEVRERGDVWKCDTPRLSAFPARCVCYTPCSFLHSALNLRHHSEGQFGGAKSETGPCSCP